MASSWREGPQASAELDAALDGLLAKYQTEPRDLWAARVANTAIALLRLGQGDDVWPLLEAGPDPRIRSHLVDRMAPLRCDPSLLIDRLRREKKDSARAALLLGLGGFGSDQLPEGRRSQLSGEILASYRDDPDPGVHAASGWLLRSWGRANRTVANDEALSTGRTEGNRRWYVTSQRQTMIFIEGRDEFQMGAPEDEPWRKGHEVQRMVRIRPFDIAMTEVTVGQFRAFRDDRPDLRDRYRNQMESDDGLPITEVSWYDAVAYCNWLSRREGLEPEELCYEPNGKGKYADGMKVVSGFLTRRGYRLPLESEWEYACRSGTRTSRCYGDADGMLSRYACYVLNSTDRPCPVGSLLPNAFGLFDMHGNV